MLPERPIPTPLSSLSFRGDNPNFEKISIKDAEEISSETPSAGTKEESDWEFSDIPVVNFVSSEKRPITWGKFMDYNLEHGLQLGSMVSIWHFTLT